jgi:hypothetical protein
MKNIFYLVATGLVVLVTAVIFIYKPQYVVHYLLFLGFFSVFLRIFPERKKETRK